MIRSAAVGSCGRCRVPVPLGPDTTRSSTGTVWCERCGSPPAEDRYGGAPPVYPGRAGDLDAWLDRHDPHRAVRDGLVAEDWRDGDEDMRCADCGARGGLARVAGELLCGDCRCAVASRSTTPADEFRSAAPVLWLDPYGIEVRGREPDGRPRIGTAYESRWWAPGNVDAQPRIFGWEPR